MKNPLAEPRLYFLAEKEPLVDVTGDRWTFYRLRIDMGCQADKDDLYRLQCEAVKTNERCGFKLITYWHFRYVQFAIIASLLIGITIGGLVVNYLKI
jgi:hypothetical protein